MAQPPHKSQPGRSLPGERLQQGIPRGIAAILLLLLLREWLVPLQQLSEVTELYEIKPFLIAFALFIAVDTLRPALLPGALLKVIIIVAVTAILHSGHWLPGAGWLAEWGRDLVVDTEDMLRGHFTGLEPATRTMLFMSGWAFFIYVLQSFIIERQRIAWFIAMTLIYLVMLQLIFNTDMSGGLLNTTCAGLLLLGVLQADRWLQRRETAASQTKLVLPMLFTSFIIAGMCAAAAWLGAMQHPAAGKPIDLSGYFNGWEKPFTNSLWDPSYTSKLASLTYSSAKTGYGSDDSFLGSPLTPDNAVAFVARTTQLTYWRGESKSFYTGHGWEQQEDASVPVIPSTIAAQGIVEDGASKPVKDVIDQELFYEQTNQSRQLFFGGRLARIEAIVSSEGKSIPVNWVWQNPSTDRIFLPALSDPLSSYKVQVTARHSMSSAQPETTEAASPELRETYLQLPAKLPARVTELSEKLTYLFNVPYDKAMAIESYLKNTYSYSLDKPRPVSPGEDIVDQFLFEQQAGYCDHFSSAMVVMLRAAGIPARWVKGFAPGETVDSTPMAVNEFTLEPKSLASQPELSLAPVSQPLRASNAPTQLEAKLINKGVSGELAARILQTPLTFTAVSASRNTGVLSPEADYTVVVRNSDAHSWVEAWIPAVGWVTFDPTPGFNGGEAGASRLAAVERSGSGGLSEVHQPAEASPSSMSFYQRSIRDLRRLAADLFHILTNYAHLLYTAIHQWSGGSPQSQLWTWIALLGVLLLILVLRRRLLWHFIQQMPPLFPSEGTIPARIGPRSRTVEKLANKMWLKLQRRMGSADPTQTLREYALTRTLGNERQFRSLLRMLRLLEMERYRNGAIRITREELCEAWADFKNSKS